MNWDELKPNNNYMVWGFWGTIIWAIVIALVFLFTEGFTMGVHLVVTHPGVSPDDLVYFLDEAQGNGTLISLITVVTLVVCTLLMLGIIKLKKGSNIKHYLALNGIGIKELRFWLLVIAGMILLADLMTYLLGKPIIPESMVDIHKSTDLMWLLWFSIVIAAPVLEELFFRGFVLTGLAGTFMRPAGAIVLTSLAWAATHVQYEIFLILVIFIFGLVLGYARLKTNSVLLTICLHAFMNLVSMTEAAILI